MTELFDVSVCLLIGSATNLTNLTEHNQRYLDTQCRCRRNTSVKSRHGHVLQFKDMKELGHEVLACADKLSKINMDMVKSVLPKFLQRVVALEMRLKRRVLCDDQLQAVQPRFEHMMLNVSAIYTRYKRES